MLAFGSLGDVLPYAALAAGLEATRRFEVRFVTHQKFKAAMSDGGLNVHAIETDPQAMLTQHLVDSLSLIPALRRHAAGQIDIDDRLRPSLWPGRLGLEFHDVAQGQAESADQADNEEFAAVGTPGVVGTGTPGRNEWFIHKSLLAGRIPPDIPFLTGQTKVYSAHLLLSCRANPPQPTI